MSETLLKKLDSLASEEGLLPSAANNLRAWISGGFLPQHALDSIDELLTGKEVQELNDRFYQYLAFGTGGMRGRTIAARPTEAELGGSGESAEPGHPGVGSNLLNEFTVVRATVGLFRYCQKSLCDDGVDAPPRLVIAHDVRFFSRFFCELAASVWIELGGQAFIFDGPRSTPQLSFSVRHLKAHAGIVITASHNPPHDNGYKVYFSDGAQVVPPVDQGIISEVEAVALADLGKMLTPRLEGIQYLGPEDDEAYLASVLASVLDPTVFGGSSLKAVYTPIHGTGGIMTAPALHELGVDVEVLAAQAGPHPRFPTVRSPNPENAEALALAIERAEETGADIVMGTDPDCDRMGVAVRDECGRMELLTGNQIGALLAEYRLQRLKEMGLLPAGGTEHAGMIKTFVTTPMQDVIAKNHGIRVVNTLTGFKWIGAKLLKYERQLVEAIRKEGDEREYDQIPLEERTRLHLRHGLFYVFGGEESYGYLPSDAVRDKDGNAACVIFCEMAAWLKSKNQTIPSFLDSMYQKYGYFLEMLGQIYYEGAAGSTKIARILASYRSRPPKTLADAKVMRFRDFGREKILDEEGDVVPAQDLYFLDLDNGYSYAVRGSGTEPKIKFYLFAREDVASPANLPDIKQQTRSKLKGLRNAIEADADARAEVN